jgi:putative addiction module component (TIGR02574 family)
MVKSAILLRSRVLKVLMSLVMFVSPNVMIWLLVHWVIMSNHPLLKVEISQLSVAERIQLVEDLWDSILDKTDEIQLNEAQQQELDRRLERHQQDPNAGSTWENVKERLGFSR